MRRPTVSLPLVLFALSLLVAVPLGAVGVRAKGPCALVTAADAKKALGGAVGPKKEQTLGLYESCSYASKKSATVSLTVQTRQLSHGDFVKSAKANPGSVQHVAGIGSDAYSAGGGSTLLVWRHGTSVTLLVLGVPNPLAVEKQLGKKAANRL